MDSLEQLKKDYEKEGKPHLRVGQYFICKYIATFWPELFYAESKDKCWKIIETWLKNHQYNNNLPKPTSAWLREQDNKDI